MLGQRGHMFGWVPVCIAAGIGIYFSLRFEPVTPLYVGAGSFGGTGLLLAKRFGEVLSPIFIGICLVGIGFTIAAWRTHSLEAPVLGWRYYGAIEGRIIGMDRSASDAVRITLDQVRLERVSPSRTPQKVRISLHKKAAQGIRPLPGMRVMTTGHLSPPSGPVEPGGFDFQRHAWFGQLGAVGYTRVPLIGFVFASLRLFLIFLPYLGPRIAARKIAAGGALLIAAAYLALSGGNVAAERAFIMVAVALIAIMLNRRAISLRAVAIAATIVLVLRPEALLGPGFQMSFAATTGLVAVFGWMRDGAVQVGPKWAQPFVVLVISSGVAGLTTAPIGAAHFNTVAHYGLVANLLSVPLMGLVIIPSAVLAAILAPFGLEEVGLWAMGFGLRWILLVAGYVADFEGAKGYVAGPSPLVLPMLSIGALWLILWQGRLRNFGPIMMAASFIIWASDDRPLVLIAENGSLLGVMTDQGRALSKEKGAGFVARNWLENDGDPSLQSVAASLWGTGMKRMKVAQVGAYEFVHLIGKKAVFEFDRCQSDQIVIASVETQRDFGNCTVHDPKTLRNSGSIGLYLQGDEAVFITARDISGDRIWSAWPSKQPSKKADQKTRPILK